GRGTVLGFLIGIIPGSAHIIASFVSYAVERRLSAHPEEFGRGAVAGVAGPESANNSATSGAFVPMLALGVPSGPIPAVMLAPMIEMALRQSLAMSDGHYGILVTRPIAGALLAVGAVLVLLGLRPLVTRSLDWRAKLALAGTKEERL